MKFLIDKLKQINRKRMAIGKARDMVAKRPHVEGAELEWATEVELVRAITPRLAQVPISSDEAAKVCSTPPMIIPTPSSIERSPPVGSVSLSMGSVKLPTPPMSPSAVDVRSPSQVLVGTFVPSAPPPGMV